jgi:hypothetical protein
MLTSKQRAAIEFLADKSEQTLGSVARHLLDRGISTLEKEA